MLRMFMQTRETINEQDLNDTIGNKKIIIH